jgi:hypothetical protein
MTHHWPNYAVVAVQRTRIARCNKSACGPRLTAFFRTLGTDHTLREGLLPELAP